MVEIERRFLVKYLPPQLQAAQEVEIEDYKILTGEDHPHLRLRRRDNCYELTKKYPIEKDKKLEMVEETINLTEVEFEAFKKAPNTGQVKTRYVFKYQNYEAEFDIWEGDLKGLVIVEFDFKMPEFCLTEVTQKEWLSGGKLSGKSYGDVANRLEAIGYKPL
jgi:adenylate cyclase